MTSSSNPPVIDVARELIYGERAKTYEPPHINFQVISELWEAYMKPRVLELMRVSAEAVLQGGITDPDDIDPEAALMGQGRILDENDTCNLMTLLKMAREASGQGYHRDSTIDAIGYQAIKEVLQTPLDQFLKEMRS